MSPAINADDLPIREDLRGVKAYGAPQLDVDIRLNTNENPHPPPLDVLESISRAVNEAAAGLQRYPDRDAIALRQALAGYLSDTTGESITVDQVWAANGSNETLSQLISAFAGPGRRVLGFEPSYSMHSIIARGTGSEYIAQHRADDFSLSVEQVVSAIEEHDPHVVMLCSPNNPTGTAMDPELVIAAYDAVAQRTHGVVIVDEAYAEFSHNPSLIPLLKDRPRLVVTRTMSKAFAFAGARVGYFAADPAVVEAVLRVRLPYHLSALTQAAATAAIGHAKELQAGVEELKRQRDRIVAQLREWDVPVADSDANFVLFGGLADSHQTWQELLDAGILIRDVGIPGWLRVTAGTENETTAFLNAFEQIITANR